MELKNLISDEEHTAIKELCAIIPIVKNKWFSMGRDMDKLMKLLNTFCGEKKGGI